MTTMRRISFMALALTLGGGGLQSAGADQVSDASDSPPRFQEPPPPPSTPLQSLNSSAGSDWVPSSSIRIHNDQGIRYISGGVAEDERTELKTLSNQFNLRLQFAMQGSGDYLSAVDVNIRDANGGTILSTKSKGPWLFAQLEHGNYSVEVSSNDHVQQQPSRQSVQIDGSHQHRLDFYWQ